MKFTIQFHRVICEQAFLEIEAAGIVEARCIAEKVSPEDQRLEFEPMSSTTEIASVWATEFKSEMPS